MVEIYALETLRVTASPKSLATQRRVHAIWSFYLVNKNLELPKKSSFLQAKKAVLRIGSTKTSFK